MLTISCSHAVVCAQSVTEKRDISNHLRLYMASNRLELLWLTLYLIANVGIFLERFYGQLVVRILPKRLNSAVAIASVTH